MPVPPPTVGRTTEQLKHLEFVQQNIARMHNASTYMKRLALVIFVMGASLARFLHDPTILGITSFVIASFYVLDSKYLQAERAFRFLYKDVRNEPAGAAATFDLTPDIKCLVPFCELRSWSTFLLYPPILLLLFLLWVGTDWQAPATLGTNNG